MTTPAAVPKFSLLRAPARFGMAVTLRSPCSARLEQRIETNADDLKPLYVLGTVHVYEIVGRPPVSS